MMITCLSKYQFHIDVIMGVRVVNPLAVAMTIITMMTVFFQSRKAALTNPAETLRTE